MSSVIISGDTSGAITLAAPAVAGTNTITLPANTGTVALTASPTFTGTATIPTATITTLNAPSGVLATQNGMTGIAKAWVYFVGSSGTITSSFNVSSVTRNATGKYTVNFTTAMADANYSIQANINYTHGSTSAGFVNGNATGTDGSHSTTQCAVTAFNASIALFDPVGVYVAIFGN